MTVWLHLKLHSSGSCSGSGTISSWMIFATSEDGGGFHFSMIVCDKPVHVWCLSPKLSCQFFVGMNMLFVKTEDNKTWWMLLPWHGLLPADLSVLRTALTWGKASVSSVIQRELIMAVSLTPPHPASIFYYTSTHSSHNVLFYLQHIENGQMNAWSRKICKSTSCYNPAVITRGTKEQWSHETAPPKMGMSRGMFQIIPASQNNTVTHKYHPTSEWISDTKPWTELHPRHFYLYCIPGRIPAIYFCPIYHRVKKRDEYLCSI